MYFVAAFPFRHDTLDNNNNVTENYEMELYTILHTQNSGSFLEQSAYE